MATVGVDYGIPGQVATRAVYGLRGSKLMPSLLRSIASLLLVRVPDGDRRDRDRRGARKADRHRIIR